MFMSTSCLGCHDHWALSIVFVDSYMIYLFSE